MASKGFNRALGSLLLIAVGFGLYPLTAWVSAKGSTDKQPIVDSALVGTWLSADHHGYRVVFMYSGELVGTMYGRPKYGAEKWTAYGGKIYVQVYADHGLAAQEVTYSITPDGQRLTISQDVFGPGAKEFVRAMTKP